MSEQKHTKEKQYNGPVGYLTPDSPGAFEGMKPFPKPIYPQMGEFVLCPKCRGYGGWHLRLNAYGPGKHFNGRCDQCNGWGWVVKGSRDETCLHEWETRWVAMHERQDTCTKCGTVRRYDTSG